MPNELTTRIPPVQPLRPVSRSPTCIASVMRSSASPPGSSVHPKLAKLLAARHDMSRNGGIDWAFAELAAFGSLLLDDVPVRISGQDTRRGTFAQRHAVLHDRLNGRQWNPLQHLGDGQAPFGVYDSLLSEYAVAASNTATRSATQMPLCSGKLSSATSSTAPRSSSTSSSPPPNRSGGKPAPSRCCFPHGYEGRGPDHSSGRIERFLQLCAQDNMTVAQPSTPASYFHLLRRHAYVRPRHPLIVFTPKSMLRTRAATSSVEDLVHGRFEPVIPDARLLHPDMVRRVLVVSGKLYWELLKHLSGGGSNVALVRLEQFYPLPFEQIRSTLARYPHAEVVWVQDEPRNQGAWSYLMERAGPTHLAASTRHLPTAQCRPGHRIDQTAHRRAGCARCVGAGSGDAAVRSA